MKFSFFELNVVVEILGKWYQGGSTEMAFLQTSEWLRTCECIKGPELKEGSHNKPSQFAPENTWEMWAAGARPAGRRPALFRPIKGFHTNALVKTELGKTMSTEPT